MFFIRFIFYFSFSFIILCIPVRHATVFDYLHEFVAPVTQPLFESVKDGTMKSIEKGKEMGGKLFSNARPRKQDIIKIKKSSIQKRPNSNDENYTQEEKELLNNVLKSAY